MNTAKYVDEQIQVLKNSGIPYAQAAWEAAQLCIGWPYIFGDRGEYCTPAKRQAVYNKHPDQTGLVSKCQVLNGAKKDCVGCKWLPGGERVRSFDCRGFTYWILLQIYGWKLMGAGATSQWNTEDNWKAKGTIDSMPTDTLVCLFVKKGNTMSHTGFGLNNETIECSNGVQYSKTRNKKWTHWGVPYCVETDVPTPTPGPGPEPSEKPTLRRGDSGPYVVELQNDLLILGYDLGSYGADGKFGKKTESAVKAFQKDHGLTADGIVGQKTWAALDAAMPTPEPEPEPEPVASLYTVKITMLTKYQAEGLLEQYPGSVMIEEGR